MRRATIYTLDQSMFAGGIGIELARTWENEINNWGTCESPLKFGGVGRPCHDLPYLPRTPREPIMPSRVKSRQVACHLPDGPGPKHPKSVSNPQKRTNFGRFFWPCTLKSPKAGQT